LLEGALDAGVLPREPVPFGREPLEVRAQRRGVVAVAGQHLGDRRDPEAQVAQQQHPLQPHERVGVGTVAFALLIGPMVNVTLPLLRVPEADTVREEVTV
jgi:uncharacterized membrane protein YczE